MLMLTRRINEEIIIGDNIVVRICAVSNFQGRPQFKIAVDAPREVNIVRAELARKSPRSARS